MILVSFSVTESGQLQTPEQSWCSWWDFQRDHEWLTCQPRCCTWQRDQCSLAPSLSDARPVAWIEMATPSAVSRAKRLGRCQMRVDHKKSRVPKNLERLHREDREDCWKWHHSKKSSSLKGFQNLDERGSAVGNGRMKVTVAAPRCRIFLSITIGWCWSGGFVVFLDSFLWSCCELASQLLCPIHWWSSRANEFARRKGQKAVARVCEDFGKDGLAVWHDIWSIDVAWCCCFFAPHGCVHWTDWSQCSLRPWTEFRNEGLAGSDLLWWFDRGWNLQED